MSNRRRASVAFILTALALDALGVGIIAPVVPGFAQQLGHLPPERAAPWVGAMIAASAGMQFFAAPLLGELSDRFGRRPVILAPIFGLGCDYVLLALASNLGWLFAGRLIAGATSANVAAATAYIAAREERPAFVWPVAVQSSLVLFTFYCFGWGPQRNGVLLAGVGLSQATVAGFMLRHVNTRLGKRKTVVTGCQQVQPRPVRRVTSVRRRKRSHEHDLLRQDLGTKL